MNRRRPLISQPVLCTDLTQGGGSARLVEIECLRFDLRPLEWLSPDTGTMSSHGFSPDHKGKMPSLEAELEELRYREMDMERVKVENEALRARSLN